MLSEPSSCLPMARAQRRSNGLNYKCDSCGRCFATRHQLGGHLSKGRVCAAVITTAQILTGLPAVPPSPNSQSDSSEPQEITVNSAEQDVSSNESADEPADFPGDCRAEDGEHTDIPFVHLYQLLQRLGKHDAKHRITDTILRPGSRAHTCNPRNTLKLEVVRFPARFPACARSIVSVFTSLSYPVLTYAKTARIQ